MSTASGAAPRAIVPFGTKTTAQQLKERGVPVESPTERLRLEIFRRLDAARKQGLSREEATATLFPKTVLPPESYEDLTTALVAGSHVLFFGPSGAGKTNLAKEVWELFPKDAWVVANCPVLDHPLSIVDPKVADRFSPCPICRRRFSPGNDVSAFDPGSIDPTKVPAEMVRLREGYGFARLQGSSEVFPDHLTGNINLRRLEEIGDPMSPLVLEPGKLLQANRGLLLVDEIGKLPLGTQNVLLQALQEGTVTPSKSRESFPGMFVAVGTSNLSDLDNINDPLSDRLTSLHVTYNPSHPANRRIVQLAAFPEGASFVPEILIDAGVRVIETWRQKASDDNPDIGEVGSNRTLIDVVARTAAIASLHDHPVAGVEEIQAGLLHAMRGRIRARSGDSFDQNERRVREFVGQHLEPALKRSSGVYWCRFFKSVLKENKAEGEAVVAEGRRVKNDPALIDTLATPGNDFPRFRSFTAYVWGQGRQPKDVRPVDAAVRNFELLERYSLFTCSEEDADDDARL